MGMEQLLTKQEVWCDFLQHKKEGGHLSVLDENALTAFIDQKAYLIPVQKILSGEGFSPPQKHIISKQSSSKKRVVYCYAEEENNTLKLLTYLLQKKYDHLFADNLYSFRPGISAKTAIGRIISTPQLNQMWGYKLDISNYFNSVPVKAMVTILNEVLEDEPVIRMFIVGLLCQPNVLENGVLHPEEKGIMAGVPISGFLANLYLNALDHAFADEGILYARYSDDIILFEKDKPSLDAAVRRLKAYLIKAGLAVNPKKEKFTAPGERFEFLGVSYCGGTLDISEISKQKLKSKMRRKARALMQWKDKKGIDGIYAAKAFVKAFHRKLFDNPKEHELTWVKWYFPLINTDVSLKEIDQYRLNCIRYLATGKHNGAAYRFDYEGIKKLGYVSLVHEFYHRT